MAKPTRKDRGKSRHRTRQHRVAIICATLAAMTALAFIVLLQSAYGPWKASASSQSPTIPNLNITAVSAAWRYEIEYNLTSPSNVSVFEETSMQGLGGYTSSSVEAFEAYFAYPFNPHLPTGIVSAVFLMGSSSAAGSALLKVLSSAESNSTMLGNATNATTDMKYTPYKTPGGAVAIYELYTNESHYIHTVNGTVYSSSYQYVALFQYGDYVAVVGCVSSNPALYYVSGIELAELLIGRMAEKQ